MNKHTPGPWRHGRTLGTEKFPEWYITGKVCDVASVSIVMDTSKPMTEHEANARLIASAPTMLAALERVSEWFKQHGTAENQGIACDVFQAIDAAKGNP